MATDFLVKQGRVMGGVRLVTDADVAHQTDLTNIRETGTTASQAISAGTYFYLNDTLVRAKVAIANGATFTLNTNYEVVTAGALNEKGILDTDNVINIKSYLSSNGATYTVPCNGKVYVNVDFTSGTDANVDIYYGINTNKLSTVFMFRRPRAYQGLALNFDAIKDDVLSVIYSDSTSSIRIVSIKLYPYK